MALIKDIYSQPFYEQFGERVTEVFPQFDKEAFVRSALSAAFKDMEWKERMKHTTRVFHEFAPKDFEQAASLILAVIKQIQLKQSGTDTLAYVFFPDYISTYGLDNFDSAVKALEQVTQFVSCEFAVRPFILKYGDRMIGQMIRWSAHENYTVRRLASEGSRPRLPWAMALPALKKDPSAILPLLENLKNDPSEWVRRSVANNINDIAKDHPDLVIGLAKKWKGISKETDAIIKHGCRTLLKQGHQEILKHYGLDGSRAEISGLTVLTPLVRTGDSLEFSFVLRNLEPSAQTIRLEYGIYYLKSNGLLSKKVFKISEKVYPENAVVTILRKQSFRLITTRVFYPGIHQLSVIVNGEEKCFDTFSYELN
jgi:3-methyladenine DNA glycosylase AlkC